MPSCDPLQTLWLSELPLNVSIDAGTFAFWFPHFALILFLPNNEDPENVRVESVEVVLLFDLYCFVLSSNLNDPFTILLLYFDMNDELK